MKIYVYGSSDDLIEVEGDLSEEFDGDAGVLTFSDGTKLLVTYGEDGVWKVEQRQVGHLAATKHLSVSEDEGHRRTSGEFEGMSTYSQIMVLEGEFDGPLTVTWKRA